MKGTKRLSLSESAVDGGDTAFRSKRLVGGSPLEGLMAEQKTAMPPLDMHRAESSHQHVRALNTQFASWVQTQLKNHPDELWEDGVRDYLSHASDIMKKFSDVVNWLAANAAGGGSTTESLASEKKFVPETKDNGNKFSPDKTKVSPASANTTLATSWSSGIFSTNQISGGVPLSSQNSNLFSNNQGSAGVVSNSQSSGGVFSVSQPSNVFGFGKSSSTVTSNNQSPIGIFSGGQNSNVFGISQTSSAVTSNNQSSGGIFSSNQNSSAFSDSQGTQVFSNSQSSGFSSNSQSSGFFPSSQSTGLFSNNLSTGIFSGSQTPTLFGVQGSVPSNTNAADDADEEEVPQPSSPSVKKAEEKGIVTVHEVKCKLYVKSNDPADKDAWKDKGTGQLSIKTKEGERKGTKESKPTIVVRNEVGKVLLNAILYSGIKTNAQKNSIVAIFHTMGDDVGNSDIVVARTFLIRTKNEEERNKLATAIQEYAPAS